MNENQETLGIPECVSEYECPPVPDYDYQNEMFYEYEEMSNLNAIDNKRIEEINIQSMVFALRVFRLHKFISQTKKEYFLSKNAMASGSEIGVILLNLKRLTNKFEQNQVVAQALDKLEETAYWLKLLYKSDNLTPYEFRSIYNSCTDFKKQLLGLM